VSCTFTVTVTRTPRLSATRFVAFGDSITEGLPHACPGSLEEGLDLFLAPPRALRPPPASAIAYPARLQVALSSRYTAQAFTVINEGSGGEDVATGARDLPRVLNQDAPEALLLQEGTNDLNFIFFGGSPATQIGIIVNGLRTMIREGRGRGLPVFVGTLTPQRERACRGYAPAYVPAANDQIRALAASEGASLVDLYQAFGGVAGDLIGPDGLHPNEAGYQRIADAFFAAIRERLEK
jgi:lysophospholipase L1-like esterase